MLVGFYPLGCGRVRYGLVVVDVVVVEFSHSEAHISNA